MHLMAGYSIVISLYLPEHPGIRGVQITLTTEW